MSEADLSTPETENEMGETEISHNREQLTVQLIENPPHSSEFEEVEEAEISGTNEEQIVDYDIKEPEENQIEVKVQVGDSQIKRSPKTASNKRMRKKS